MRPTIFLLIICTVCMTHLLAAQMDINFVVVDRELMTVGEHELDTLQHLTYIHERYDSDYIDTYLETSIAVHSGDAVTEAIGKDATLTADQQRLLRQASPGDRVDLAITYIPRNNLKDNPPRSLDYRFEVVPAYLPHYVGGDEAMQAYVAKTITSGLDSLAQSQLRFCSLTFDVLADGSIHNITMLDSTEHCTLNERVVNAIASMPRWEPAKQADGHAIPHRCRFMISNTRGACLMY